MITTKTNGPVTTLVLDRPAKRNALNEMMIDSLGKEIAAVEADENCRALVITGAEGHFAAGRDLGTMGLVRGSVAGSYAHIIA